MKTRLLSIIILGVVLSVVFACSLELHRKTACHEEMVQLLKKVYKENYIPRNQFSSAAKLPYMDSLLGLPHSSQSERRFCNYLKANILLELGREKEAVRIFEKLVKDASLYENPRIRTDLAMAYLRMGERTNCVANHASESCIMPLQGVGVHRDMEGSRKAIEIYQGLVKQDPSDLES